MCKLQADDVLAHHVREQAHTHEMSSLIRRELNQVKRKSHRIMMMFFFTLQHFYALLCASTSDVNTQSSFIID